MSFDYRAILTDFSISTGNTTDKYDVNLFLSDLCIFVNVFIHVLHASGLPAMINIELNSTVRGVKHVRAIFELEILKILPISRFWA